MQYLAKFIGSLALATAVSCVSRAQAPAANTADPGPYEKTEEKPASHGPYDIYITRGPAIGNLGALAKVDIPANYIFLNSEGAIKLLTEMKNIVGDNVLGLIAPTGFPWFVVFQYDATGYVRDDDKDKLNADAMLKSFKLNDEASNKERARRGWPSSHTLDWAVPPHYDAATHNLEWAIRFQTGDRIDVNHNTRLLGRGGVMRVTLVCDPDNLNATLPDFRQLLVGYTYNRGHKYAEFRAGDKVAEYGLTALVAGGAAAVALKSGLLTKFWKLIVVAVLAVGGFFKKIIAKIRGDRDRSP